MEGEHGSSDVKFLIGRSAGRSAVIVGFIATHVATVAGLWFDGARLPTFNFNNLNGFLAFRDFGPAFWFSNQIEIFVVGGVIHYISGILWAVIFALVIHPALGRAVRPLASMTPTANLTKGIVWGVALWIISSALWMPLLIGPLFVSIGVGVGPFLTSFGPYGVQALFTNLLWHTIYGVNLGLLFSPSPAGSSRSMWKPAGGIGVR